MGGQSEEAPLVDESFKLGKDLPGTPAQYSIERDQVTGCRFPVWGLNAVGEQGLRQGAWRLTSNHPFPLNQGSPHALVPLVGPPDSDDRGR